MANCEKQPKQERDDIRFTHIAIPTSFDIILYPVTQLVTWLPPGYPPSYPVTWLPIYSNMDEPNRFLIGRLL